MFIVYLIAVWFSEGYSEMVDIPEDIGKMCPYSTICNRSATANLNMVGKKPCCHECSCDRSCGMHLNCCFEDLDTYNLVDRGLVACIEPFDGNPTLINKHSSFYMVQACYDKEKNLDNPCRTHDKLGNSLIAPVSSTYTGYIYVNAECAMCNGLKHFKAWTALFVYNYIMSPTFFHFDLKDSIIRKNALLLYQPPAAEGWYNQQCYENYYNSDIASKCKDSEFNDLCSNLNAPYTDILGVHYKNIYCMRCQKQKQKIQFECEDFSDRRGTVYGSLTRLMDAETIVYLTQNNNKETFPSLTGQNCVTGTGTNSQKECLRIYCPEGMIETPKGCRYFGQWWYSAYFLMQVKLIPFGDETPYVSHLTQLSTTDTINPLNWIHPPCKNVDLTEIKVYYEHSANETDADYIKSFIVVFGKNTVNSDGFNPATVIPTMRQCIDYSWRMRINETTYLLNASFDEYTNYVQDGEQTLGKYSVEKNRLIPQDDPDPAIYHVVSVKASSDKDLRLPKLDGIWLRKTYYCKQVRLSIDKVVIDYGRITIFSKNLTLGSNKYTFNYSPNKQADVNNETVSVSVCLEDYVTYDTYNEGSRRFGGFMVVVFCQFVMALVTTEITD